MNQLDDFLSQSCSFDEVIFANSADVKRDILQLVLRAPLAKKGLISQVKYIIYAKLSGSDNHHCFLGDVFMLVRDPTNGISRNGGARLRKAAQMGPDILAHELCFGGRALKEDDLLDKS